MATLCDPPPAVSVVGGQFCAPYPVDVTVMKKALSTTGGDFTVTDANGNVVFAVKGVLFSFRRRRVLLDAAGNPLLSMQEKVSTGLSAEVPFFSIASPKSNVVGLFVFWGPISQSDN